MLLVNILMLLIDTWLCWIR